MIMKRKIEILREPFPHIVVQNFYTPEELELIWEELKFLNKPGKLGGAEDFHGGKDVHQQRYITNHHALNLDNVYLHNRHISNILTVSQKVFDPGFLNLMATEFPECARIKVANYSFTKVRYYKNNEHYEPHVDLTFDFLAFSYFNEEPKKFTGGELYFPEHDYEFECENNSLILMPSYIRHGVKEVGISKSDEDSGYGRYAITHFFGHTMVTNENTNK